jgi:hypothetical protein
LDHRDDEAQEINLHLDTIVTRKGSLEEVQIRERLKVRERRRYVHNLALGKFFR